jgi:hypothetical protein
MKLLKTPDIALFVFACSILINDALALTRHQVAGFRNGRSLVARLPVNSATQILTVPIATFKQMIDHDIPSLGTFSQFYYYPTECCKEPGSPVVSSSKI